MVKVKYKKVSPELEALVAPNKEKTGRRSLGFEEKVGEFFYLNTEDLIPYKNQSRKIFEDKDLRGLSETIKSYGVRQPLSVIPSEINKNKFEVISGERRLRASKLLGLEKIPCIILTKEPNTEEIALIENIQRKNLHPVELAEGFNSILTKKERGSLSRLSEKLGISKSFISETLKLNELPGSIKDYLLEKNIKSRVILRSLVKFQSLEEMNSLLGIEKTEQNPPRRKRILGVFSSLGDISIDINIDNIPLKQREDLKINLLALIEKL